MITEKIDYSELDKMIAKQLLRQNGGEEMRQAIISILEQGGDAQDVSGRVLEFLPTFTGTANQLKVITDYLRKPGNNDQ